MLQNAHLGHAQMVSHDHGSANTLANRCKRMWFAAIEALVRDYAYLRRLEMVGELKKRKHKERLERATFAMFNEEGALTDIVYAVSDQPDYLIEHLRGAVSDEQILAGVLMGRRMRLREVAR